MHHLACSVLCSSSRGHLPVLPAQHCALPNPQPARAPPPAPALCRCNSYNIIAQLGVKMIKLTPSRGFSAEIAAALTISVASRYGLPVSTTQIIVGAEIGVGLVESVRHGCVPSPSAWC